MVAGGTTNVLRNPTRDDNSSCGTRLQPATVTGCCRRGSGTVRRHGTTSSLADDDLAAVLPLEEPLLPLRGPDLEEAIPGPAETEEDPVPAQRHLHVLQGPGPIPVEGVGDAQDPGQQCHPAAVPRGEGGVLGVGVPGHPAAVVAGHLGDELLLLGGDAGQLAFADEVSGVLVGLDWGDHGPDVVGKGGDLQNVPILAAQGPEGGPAGEQ